MFSCRGTPGTCSYFVSCSEWSKFTLLQPPICSLSSPNWPQPFPSVLLLYLAIQMLSFSLDFGQALNLALWLNILSHFFSRNSVWDLLSFPVLVCLTLSSIWFLLSASPSSWSLSHLPGIDTSIGLFHNTGKHRNTGPISVCCGFSLLFVLLYQKFHKHTGIQTREEIRRCNAKHPVITISGYYENTDRNRQEKIFQYIML